jgi:hypothetical protein
VPIFNAPDCTPWVIGGLWPAELSTINTQTAPLITHLKADLQRIVDDANNELTRLRMAGLPHPVQRAHEARIINEARAMAIGRVESTVRGMRSTNTRTLNRQQWPSSGHLDTTPRPRFKITPAVSAATANTERLNRQQLPDASGPVE